MSKKIWITGASSGIGKALAIKFANEGWQVAASARRENLLQDLNKNNSNISNLSVEEAYKILNLNRNNKITKEDVQKAYLKIQKKIHPDVSPETSRLSAIVNEAKEVVLQDLS